MHNRQSRVQLLEKVGNNVGLLSHHQCLFDLQTDSKLELDGFTHKFESNDTRISKYDVERLVAEKLGFPYAILMSQGRLAEAVFAKTLIRNACIVPNHGMFPTLKAHLSFNGALTPECILPDAISMSASESKFDVAALHELFSKRSAFWVPCIALEASNNALHGQFLPNEHLNELASICSNAGSSVYMDACRLISNVLAESVAEASSKDIIFRARNMLSHVNHLTMSFSKDLPLPIGAVFCTRSAEVYQRATDISLVLGSGIPYSALQQIQGVFSDLDSGVEHARDRLKQSELLGSTISEHTQHEGMLSGAHGVFLELASTEDWPGDAISQTFLYKLYVDHGIRASINPISDRQKQCGSAVIRLAIPGGVYTNDDIMTVGTRVAQTLAESRENYFLRKVGQPPGLSGAFRASYEIVTNEESYR